MRKYSQGALILGFTAVFVGYLSVWLRGPGAGLSFLGLEMGEWFKFLGLGPRRDFFYLPPITLGLMLAIWTMTWPARDGLEWRAWGHGGISPGVKGLWRKMAGWLGRVAGEDRTVVRIALVWAALQLVAMVWDLPGAWGWENDGVA